MMNKSIIVAAVVASASAVQLKADREPLLTWRPTPKKGAYPKDYFVPNFGTDREIIDNHEDIKVAEGMIGHHWKFDLEKPPVNPAKKTLYDDKPALDEEIIDSRTNLKQTESLLSHKFDLELVQLDSKAKA